MNGESWLSVVNWREYFTDRGVHPDLTKRYIEYIKRQYNRELPVIFEYQHLAALLGRTPEYIRSAVSGTKSHYRRFSIPKRRGGKREIATPYPALLECQRWILNNILDRVSIGDCAHGFVRNKSILTNAKIHIHQKQILKMDIAEFFPSVQINKVISIFRRLGYPRNVSVYLGRLCTLDGKLPQGAATSPYLSNIISIRMDARLNGLAKSLDLRYTRYADDLTFSGKVIPNWLPAIVREILQEEGFQVSEKKTVFVKERGKRIVTGISISENRPKVPRGFKRSVRQEAYYVLKHGYFSHVGKRRIRNPRYLESLIGKVDFWRWVEPDSAIAQKYFSDLKELQSRLGS